jgi:hypothetical protein
MLCASPDMACDTNFGVPARYEPESASASLPAQHLVGSGLRTYRGRQHEESTMTDTPVPDRDDDQLPPLPDWGPTDGKHGTDADPEVRKENDENSLGNSDK